MKNYELIAKEAIRRAAEDLKKDYIILHCSDKGLGGIDGYLARQIDGERVSGMISAQTEIGIAKQQIYKMGRNKKAKTIDAEAMNAIKMLDEFEELNFPEEE